MTSEEPAVIEIDREVSTHPRWWRRIDPRIAATAVAAVAVIILIVIFGRGAKEATLRHQCYEGLPEERIQACEALTSRLGRRSAEPSEIASAYRMLAMLENERGNLAQALTHYESGLRVTPTNSALLVGRAGVHAERGELDAALQDYTAAISFAPTDYAPRFSRGYLYDKLGRVDSAIEDWTEGLKHVGSPPHGLGALESLGHAYVRKLEFTRALDAYSKALAIDATNPRALYGRGVTKRALGDRAGGAEDMAAAIRLQADIPAKMAAVGVGLSDEDAPASRTFTIAVLNESGSAVVQSANNLTRADIADVKADTGADGRGVLSLTFTPEGAAKMKALTSENIGRDLALVVDDKLNRNYAVRIDAVIVDAAQIAFPSLADANDFLDGINSAR